MRSEKRIKLLLIIVGLASVISVIWQFASISSFNAQQHSVSGKAEDEESYMDLSYRGDSTSMWIKRDLALNGITYDGILHNASSNEIGDWTLRIDITGDCYINQFWNGTVEIHQNEGRANQKVQLLDLAHYDKNEIRLDYKIDDSDLLIPLSAGDYIIYYPSGKFMETPVDASGEVIIGTIFYYEDELDLSNYTLEFRYHKSFTQGAGFITSALLMLLWLFIFAMYQSARYAYRNAQKAMELRKEGISSMSDLYAVVYIVDLIRNKIIPVVVKDEEAEKQRPADEGADEQFRNLFQNDADPVYRNMMLDFCDLKTLPKRMADRGNIVIEYESTTYGWCRIRFIAMDWEKGREPEKVLFTIEQINEEKEELNEALGKVEKAESENRAKSAFLANMSTEIQDPVRNILELNKKIQIESNEETIKKYADEIHGSGNILLTLLNSILDISRLENKQISLSPKPYSIHELTEEITAAMEPSLQMKGLNLDVQVSDKIPDRLYGDDQRLKQIIENLIYNAASFTDNGTILFAVYGKVVNETTVHLLFTVNDTGSGMDSEEKEKLLEGSIEYGEQMKEHSGWAALSIGLVQGLLGLFGSQLKIASVSGRGSNVYFELDQQIINPAYEERK